MQELVSYTVLTHNRCEELRDALQSILVQSYPRIEIIIVDNASTDGTGAVVHSTLEGVNYKYVRLSENLGVSRGRNVAIQNASGEILVTIDDDAVLQKPSSTREIVDKFLSDERIGILAFKIVDYRSEEVDRVEFPTREKSRNPDEPFETSWFIGAGHAFRRSVVDKIGMYRDFSPYGSEEYDYSLRAIDAGFKISYFPSVVIKHKKSSQGRAPSTRLLAVALKNRIKAAALNLPWSAVISLAVVRSAQKILQAKGNLLVLLLAYYWLVGDLTYVIRNRSPIGVDALKKLKDLNGAIVY